MSKNLKYVFVVGGVMSGVGKGITTASIGLLLKSAGVKVTLLKADPYLNVDAGTMNPTEHGEVFVMESGLETDQDMGNYERFLNESLPKENYMTNGMVFLHVIQKERALGYGGKCVEPTFHITEEIIRRLDEAAKKSSAKCVVVEIGGTIGEYQNAIFLEVIRTLKMQNPKAVKTVMVSYVPAPSTIGEMKTKPTQNAVRQLNSYGIIPDFIIARATQSLDNKRKEKLSLMCGVEKEHIISAPDVKTIYDIPLNFAKDGLGRELLSSLGFTSKINLTSWKKFVDACNTAKKEVKIAVVGKYFATGDFVLSDAYISIIEALKISAAHLGYKVVIDWLSSQEFEQGKKLATLDSYGGVLVPGGFGSTGIDGKLQVINYCRTKKIPYFGICYGMQLMLIEYARNVLKLPKAHTTEVDPKTPDPVVMILPDQIKKMQQLNYGGSMRLGTYVCDVVKNTLAFGAYKKTTINERHRHRYEINPDYHTLLQNAGIVFSGTSPDKTLVEIAELPKTIHPFFVGCQFHPEFLARPLSPHPLFTAFLQASSRT